MRCMQKSKEKENFKQKVKATVGLETCQCCEYL